jgi:hypothetical protein
MAGKLVREREGTFSKDEVVYIDTTWRREEEVGLVVDADLLISTCVTSRPTSPEGTDAVAVKSEGTLRMQEYVHAGRRATMGSRSEDLSSWRELIAVGDGRSEEHVFFSLIADTVMKSVQGKLVEEG